MITDIPKVDAVGIKAHKWLVRVYYEDTDAQGLVYYANYLKFIERARTEMFRKLDMSPSKIHHETGSLIVVRRCNVLFKSAASLEDELDVFSQVVHLGKASLSLKQEVKKARRVLVEAKVDLAFVTKQGQSVKPVRLPRLFQERLQAAGFI